ncbi:ribosomal protein S18-alanine N-acetyltransferase [Bacillus sp. Marseille-P3661]|uniref:ribosomal protein S18-alanine N-acetyltransferase n=1 Tax=Bacillus sp. Marseille-P3661 TaxID=1936234 RepID=UPI000C835389|nr:ribosomal protein S18-alanine N-acetyltransferase [Bacillus sp. Marseille-P3661]
MEENISFRLMKLEDIEQIVYIEKNSFTLPWSRDAFYNELTTNQYAKYIVMEKGPSIIGYCGLWIILDEAHITNIAVLPQYRGKKLGDALLEQVLEFSKALGAKTVSLEVRVSNTVAQNLYRKYGFKDGGIRKNYYVDNQEDALVMWVNFNE